MSYLSIDQDTLSLLGTDRSTICSIIMVPFGQLHMLRDTILQPLAQ